MSKLMEVAPIIRRVDTVGFGSLEIPGITLVGLIQLLKTHPELIPLFEGRGLDKEMDMDGMIAFGEDILISFLASGLGYDCDDKDVRKRCGQLNPEDLLNIGEAIFEQSFPGGVKDFFERITKAAEAVDQGPTPVAKGTRRTTSPAKRGNVKAVKRKRSIKKATS